MKLHRFFAILMMIVLGASFFVACGDINGGVSGNSGDNGSGTKFTPDSLYINVVLTQGSEKYKATNQQWVKAANEDKWNESGEKKYPNKGLLSKAKLDEKNNTLLNTILFNNQKVYNS
ncbi:MAG: hypothetical protein IJ361_10015 [Spirochaetaceae bacterium]|nr:hypothetical protein [Spirochaetaceae bacterium]